MERGKNPGRSAAEAAAIQKQGEVKQTGSEAAKPASLKSCLKSRLKSRLKNVGERISWTIAGVAAEMQ